MKKLIAKIREILRNRRVRRIWMRTVSSIAGLVVFVTTYALVLPAITMESEAACGMEAHQHDDSCYEEQLICDLPESDGHTHTEECYDDAGSLVCGLEESEGHHHDASCYEKVLICGKEVHTHSPACYREDAASTAATERAAVAVTVPAAMDENGEADDAGDTGITDNTDNTDNTGIDGTAGALEIADPAETAAEGYVPALDELDFRQLLNDSTAVYYHRAADDTATKTEADAAEAQTEPEPENSGQITDWQKVDEDTELGENDILRVYLAYTIPAGSLNETNPVARYRLPANLHLTDEQIDAINQTENGLSSLYVDYETLQITDPENHSAHLGAEAVEGLRTPDQTIEEYSGSNRNNNNDRSADSKDGSEDQAAQEFISAVVKADQIYDEEGLYGEKGALLGTDLVFTFSPYTILKNRNEYDSEGTPVKAGESVSGWFTLDFNMEQVDWDGNDHTTAEITFVSDSKENKELGISPISVTLHKAVPTAPASEEKTDEDHTDAAEETHPAVSFEDSLTVHTGSLGSDITGGNGSDATGSGAPAGTLPASSKLTVSVSAEAGTFPAGTTMILSAVQDMDAVAEAVEGTVDSKTCGFQAVDISFRDKDGKEIEPLKPISVTMRSDSIKAATEDSSMAPVVVHVEDREKAETGDNPAATVIETLSDTTENKENSEKQSETPDGINSVDAISFESDAFSVYAIVYTVDFHWEVNGKTYDFSIPGGGFVSLEQIVEVLGIARSEEGINTKAGIEELEEGNSISLNKVYVSETTRKFVADVESVTFSSPELVWIGKVDNDTTVGELKSAKDLEIQYSTKLTEEQIAAINKSTVKKGDWALISIQPFNSTESLIVTMKTGDVFEIKVTDEQPNNPYGLGGQTFVIVNRKNNQDSALTASDSSQNSGCLSGTNIANITSAPRNLRWTFEYTGNGKDFLVHDQDGKYLIINNDRIALGTQEDAMQNPIVVEYDNIKDRYALKAKKSDQALNNYGNDGFGRWTFSAGNQDFWMQLRSPDSIKKPGTIETADTRAEGITINLFDYGPDSLDLEGNTVNNLTNEGINYGHPLKFVSHGTAGDSLNHYTGGTNGSGGDGTQYRAMQGIVQPALSGDYPVLTGYTANNGGSLQYLFDPTTTVNGKTSYGDVNHLFTKDEKGYYQYDSNMNYAYYDTSSANRNRDFTVYANSFNEEGTVQNEKVGFFPFNDYDSKYNCIHGGTPNDENGFGYYSPHWTSTGVNQGYHSGLDKLGHYNHHFGMSMQAEFVMTADGKYNGEDMEFSFSGDDDMWVFVDGVLVLDIGGIHNPVSGSINFRTGDVTVSAAKTVNSAGAKAGPTSLTEAFSRVTGKEWDSTPFSNHKLQVFYLERGGMYSNCKIGFNLPTYRTLSLSKRLTGLTDTERAKYKNEEFHYEVVVNDQLYNGNDTVRFNAAGEVIESGFAIINGQVSIKDGETVTITGLQRTDTFYAAEEKSVNMAQYEVPHAERTYVDSQQRNHEEEIPLTKDHTQAQGVNLDDWKTKTYKLENTEKVTFTNTLIEKNLEVEKKWEGDKEHPDNVKFTVSASVDDGTGKLVPYEVTSLKNGTNDKQFTLSEGDNWRVEIEHLPAQTPDGKTIVYDIKEMHVEGFVSNTRDLTAEKYNYCDVDVVKFWPDEQPRSEVITVKLQNKAGEFYAGMDAQGNAIFNNTGKTYELKQSNNYTYRFERLPADDSYKVIQGHDQDDYTTGLVSFVRNIIQYEIVNTPTGAQVDPEVEQDNPEIHKRIDALRDKANNPDTTIDDPDNEGKYSQDLSDLYRLYLDYKINSLQSASGVDLLFVIDHSGSMNNTEWQGNPFRAPAVMEALNGQDGLISKFLAMDEKNQWAAVGFKGDDGEDYYKVLSYVPFRIGDTGYRAENAGDNDSEVLSPWNGRDYTWNNNATDIILNNEGANRLTDYTAGLWRAEQFLTQEATKKDGRKKVVVFISDGIPTLHIPDLNNTLSNAGTARGSKYYRDADGGCPNETLEEFRYFVTDMQNNGYVFGDNLEFYTIGFGGSMQTASGSELLNGMLDAVYGEKAHKGHFMTISDTQYETDWFGNIINYDNVNYSTAVNTLQDDLRTILGMNETFTNIVIEDDLSRYVDLCGLAGAGVNTADIMRAANAKVTMTIPDPTQNDPSNVKTVVLYENGAPSAEDEARFKKTETTKASIIRELQYDSSSKTVKAIFDPAYKAQPSVTYTLSFDVKTTDTAYTTYETNKGYDKYAEGSNSGQIIKGDPDTDYKGTDPANATSSGKEGFRSNDSARATYKHNDENEEKVYPHPVIQVFDAPIQLLKIDQSGEPLAGAEFSLYKDAYDTAGTPEADAANTANLLKANMRSTLKGDEPNQMAEISVETLRPGTYYLVETKTPSGYNSIEPIKIVVSVVTTVKEGVTSDAVYVTASQAGNALTNFLEKPNKDSTKWVLKVQNTSGYELPSTGGPGTRLFTILGNILILGAGVLLCRKWRFL